MPTPDPTSSLIEVKGLGVHRSGRWLVHDLDFSLRPGRITTLIGPNGAGKTTAAKLALGIMKPDAGTVRRAPGLRIGYVPQQLSIEATLPLTVKRLLNLTAAHGAEDVARALDAVGIAHLAAAPVHHLSGGEFQRALLARAIVRKPDLLVLDEPVQGVDFAGQVALYELIHQIRSDTESNDPLIQVPFVSRHPSLLGRQQFEHVAKTGDVVVSTAHQHGASRRTAHRCVEIAESHSLVGQAIKVRSPNLSPEATDVCVSHVVGHDQQYIWSLIGR